MRSGRGRTLRTAALGLVAVAGVWSWVVVQAPGAGGTGFALAQAAVLLAAATHALYRCWLSAADWIVPADRRSWSGLRAEFAQMVATAALSGAVIGVCVGALARKPALGSGIALCAALAMASCALAYACGRIGLLLRKRWKRRHPHALRALRTLRAGTASR